MSFPALRPACRTLNVAFAIATTGIVACTVAARGADANPDEPEVVAPVTFGAASSKVAPVPSGKTSESVAEIGLPGRVGSVGIVGSLPQIGLPAQVGSSAQETAPIGFNLSQTARDVALLQITAGTLTPEAAWQSGALTYDNIADLLEHPSDPWIINVRQSDGGLHHQLIALLLRHESAKLEHLLQVPVRLRLWLADYYEAQQNEKVVEVAESILTGAKPSPATDDVNFQALERMAWYYGKEKQFEQAAQQWARVPELMSAPGWERADAAWLEAELWMVAGDKAKADQAFARVAVNKDPFFSGASALTLASFAYQNGDEAQATKLAQSAVESLATSQHSATSGFKGQAQNLLDALEQWKKAPLISNVQQLRFDFSQVPLEQDVLTQKIKVRSHQLVELKAQSDTNLISAQVSDQAPQSLQDENSLMALFKEQELAVTVKRPTKAVASTENVKVTSATFPGFVLQIPVEVVYSPFKLSAPSLFFGFVEAGKESKQQLTLTAATPFRVIEAKSDLPALKTSFSSSPATQQTVTVTIQGSQSQILQGQIRIQTDLPAQEVIELPYYAYIQPAP